MTALSKAAAIPLARDGRVWVEGLYRQYGGQIYRFMFYRLGQREEAQDLTGLVFQRVIENQRRYDPHRGSEAVWLFTIARHVLIDHARRRRPTAPMEALEWVHDPGLSPQERAEKAHQLEALGRALRQLGERELAVLSLKYAGELKGAEIARVLGLSEKNVGVILTRARQQLRRIMEEEEAL